MYDKLHLKQEAALLKLNQWVSHDSSSLKCCFGHLYQYAPGALSKINVSQTLSSSQCRYPRDTLSQDTKYTWSWSFDCKYRKYRNISTKNLIFLDCNIFLYRTMHAFIFLTTDASLLAGRWVCTSLSHLSYGKRRVTHWTGCLPITSPYRTIYEQFICKSL